MRVHVDSSMTAWQPHNETVPWTGHQPWLWHPGILAKYIAADALVAGLPKDVAPINVVVDHDTQDALRLELPVQTGDALSVRRNTLANTQADVPPACQPAADSDAVIAVLRNDQRDAGADCMRLIAAFDHAESRNMESLAQQLAAVLRFLMQPWVSRPARDVSSSTLHHEPWFGDELHTLLHDARNAARRYNAAVITHPEAGVTPLRIEPDRVELPVWLLGWERPRRRVFADDADTDAWLVTEDGERVDPTSAWLAPKALWMTALLRRRIDCCLGFIHGTGGGVYDRAMEAWWQAWRDEPLAPQAVATVDLTLSFDAPVSDRSQHDRAVWLTHHLPHNLDRVPSISAGHPDLVTEKQSLLAGMDDDRDKKRRRSAFDRIHTINNALADAHHALIDRADTELKRARIGLTNAAVASKRDWCFALYPDESLQALRDTIAHEVRGLATTDQHR